ncbi:MAG: hypothetical protein BVN35_08110 [Proteobacteria bacterium ST_bin11]|nr:MAG: hypothetical protein BVN35_08110 [Proteobacteria bacterium ST_bin11]
MKFNPPFKLNRFSKFLERLYLSETVLVTGLFLGGLGSAIAQAIDSPLYIDEKGNVTIGNNRSVFIDETGNLEIGTQIPAGNVKIGSNRALVIDAKGNIGVGDNSKEFQGFQVKLPQGVKQTPGVGISGGPTGNASIELRNNNSGTPFIDFSQKIDSDYDARIRLIEPGKLAVEGASVNMENATVDSLSVKKRLTMVGRLWVNMEAETTYEITDRFHLSLGSQFRNYTKTIPQDVFVALCGDRDGCQVRLGMTQWDNTTQKAAASKTFLLYYNEETGHWRADDDHYAQGTDGNKQTEHVMDAGNWHACYLTDGVYEKTDLGDGSKGMQLLWSEGGYDKDFRTCELTLID